MEGREGKSSPRLWLSSHKVAGPEIRTRKSNNGADWDTRPLCWESRIKAHDQRDTPLPPGNPRQGFFFIVGLYQTGTQAGFQFPLNPPSWAGITNCVTRSFLIRSLMLLILLCPGTSAVFCKCTVPVTGNVGSRNRKQ